MSNELTTDDRLDRIEAALKMLALASNKPKTHTKLKHGRLPETGGADHIWMNTTYCYDIARRLEYFFQALQHLLPQGEAPLSVQAMANNIYDDHKQINATLDKDTIEPGDWATAAQEAESLLILRYTETEDTYHYDEHMERSRSGGE